MTGEADGMNQGVDSSDEVMHNECLTRRSTRKDESTHIDQLLMVALECTAPRTCLHISSSSVKVCESDPDE